MFIKENPLSSRYHLFVCTGTTCSQEGAEETLQTLQKGLKHRNIRKKVRVTLCRCLGQCGKGPNMVIYPEETWYAGLGEDEIDQVIQEHLINGKRVERLVHIPVD